MLVTFRCRRFEVGDNRPAVRVAHWGILDARMPRLLPEQVPACHIVFLVFALANLLTHVVQMTIIIVRQPDYALRVVAARTVTCNSTLRIRPPSEQTLITRIASFIQIIQSVNQSNNQSINYLFQTQPVHTKERKKEKNTQWRKFSRLEPVSRSLCALLKLDDLTNQCICCMH